MQKHVSTLFLEIYRKHFGATYDATQESTWRWLTAQYISDFYVPAYTWGNPPDMCLTLCEGHRPKMFLWMLEEFAFILCHLRKDDQDGAMVLGHELLLLAHSHCRQKRGSLHPGATPLDKVPTCSYQPLERAMSAPDMIQLERLAWAVYDNVIGPSETPLLCWFETYDQIIKCLASKAYKGVHMRCPTRTSASFGAGEATEIVENPESKKDNQTPTLHNDVGCETGIQGVILHLQRKAGHCREKLIVCFIPCGESQHPWNEMDEGASMLLPGYPIGVLAVAEALDRRERGTYPSTSPQTTVCMALVFGGRTSHIPPCAYISGHWILAAPDKEE